MRKTKVRNPKKIARNRKTNHPSIIYEEKEKTKKSIGLTHAKRTFGKKNKALRKNPNPTDSATSYVVKRIQAQSSSTYIPMSTGWNLSEKDEMKVKHLIKKLEHKELKKKQKKRTRK